MGQVNDTTVCSPERLTDFSPSKQRRFGRVKLKVTIRPMVKPPSCGGSELDGHVPEGLPNCPRCVYLEKLIVSMELEIEGKVELSRLFQVDGEEERTEGA